jgi:arginase
VHLDLGAGRRGTDMGPSAMHVAGVLGRLRRLGHRVVGVDRVGVPTADEVEVGDPRARYLHPIAAVCDEVAFRVYRAMEAGAFPLVLGGDHAQAMGVISGMVRHLRQRGQRLGVVWVDAHTDMNTPDSSTSGNIHGMPLAALLGHGPPELTDLVGDGQPALLAEDVVLVGIRDVDPHEIPIVRQTGVRAYTMSELDIRGMGTCLKEAWAHAMEDTQAVHLSFDLDGVDPEHAPGVGTPVPGGLSLRESHLVCELGAATGRLRGMEVVELNPTLDLANKTGRLAVWLIESALGRTIL